MMNITTDRVAQIAESAEAILERIPAGVLFCDREGKIRFVNRAYSELTGIDREKALYRDLNEFFPCTRLMEIMARGNTLTGTIGILNTKKTIDYCCVPVRDACGDIVGLLSQVVANTGSDYFFFTEQIHDLGRKLAHYQKQYHSGAEGFTIQTLPGHSLVMEELRRKAECYSRLDEPVLILGENGTRREVLAYCIHTASRRSDGPLVSFDCGIIGPDQFDQALFGTGGNCDKIGQLELAEGGTLYLQNIGELPLDVQTHLLAVLESGYFTPVGTSLKRKANFRLISSATCDVAAMVEKGKFGKVLYSRLASLVLEILPLCQHKEDILPIAYFLLRKLGLGHVRFAPKTEAAMLRYSWPGNLQQLREAIIYAATARDSDVIQPGHFPPHTLSFYVAGAARCRPCLENIKKNAESSAIVDALAAHKNNVAAAARKLGISRATMYAKMQKYGINPRGI